MINNLEKVAYDGFLAESIRIFENRLGYVLSSWSWILCKVNALMWVLLISTYLQWNGSSYRLIWIHIFLLETYEIVGAFNRIHKILLSWTVLNLQIRSLWLNSRKLGFDARTCGLPDRPSRLSELDLFPSLSSFVYIYPFKRHF